MIFLLKDPKGILIQQTKNVQAARQIRFTNIKEIIKLRTTLKAYIKNAIEIEICEAASMDVRIEGRQRSHERCKQTKETPNRPTRTAVYGQCKSISFIGATIEVFAPIGK